MKQITDSKNLDQEAVSVRAAGNRRLFRIGLLLALGSFFSYFGLTLNLSGSAGYTWVHELLAVVGTSLALVGWWRLQPHWATRVGLGITVAVTSMLVGYVHFYTSMLPSIDGVITVGQQAPDFSLPGPDGHAVRLESFLGKPLVLVFYRGYW